MARGPTPRRERAGDPTGSVRRRGFLAGVAALGVLGTGIAGARGPDGDVFEPLGTLSRSGLAELVVDGEGTTAYGSLRNGFVAFDVSDPSAPSVLAERTELMAGFEGGPLGGIRDVKLDGDRLLVAGPNAGPARGELSGFAVFDVADPASPERVSATRTGHAIHNAFLADGVAYCTGSGTPAQPLVLYDADTGERLGSWSVASEGGYGEVSPAFRTCHDVYVRDGVAYVAYWDAGTWLLDVSDPANPTAIAQVGGVPAADLPARTTGRGFPPRTRELPGNSHYVQPDGTGEVLAVGKEAWDDEETDHDGGPGGIALWDVSDPAAARRLSIIAPPGEGDTAHNFAWRGDRLYTAWYSGGVRVFDVADPTAPRLLGSWADPENASFWTAVPAADAVAAVSYANPSNPAGERFDGEGAALYTFPDPDGEGSAAATMTPRPTRTPEPTETNTGTRTGTTPAATTADPSPTAGPTATPTEGGETTAESGGTTTEGGSGPGLGVLAALVGGGIAAWRLRDDGDGG